MKPLFTIPIRGYADAVRAGLSRVAGFCQTIYNTCPSKADGDGLRHGYSDYSAVTAPTSMEFLKIASIDKPSKEDVHIWFAAGNTIRMNPWWSYDSVSSSAKSTSANLLIDESFTLIDSISWTFPTANSLRVPGATGISGLGLITNYYSGWIAYYTPDGGTTKKFAQVKTWADAGGGAWDLTFVEDVNGATLNFASGIPLYLYRNGHDSISQTGVAFDPLYNNDLSNPVDVRADDSIIRFSGGLNSEVKYKAVHITPYMSRSFFPNSTRPFNYYGTYATSAELKAEVSVIHLSPGLSGSGIAPYFSVNQTVWLASAPIYDGFQIGALTEIDNFYMSTIDAFQNSLAEFLQVRIGNLNKRITGLIFFVAVDTGDTGSTGRVNDYFFAQAVSFLSSDTAWIWNGGTDQVYQTTVVIDYDTITSIIAGAGTTYVQASGIIENSPDTSYAYSQRSIIEGRHVLTNVYVSSESRADRERLFINPIGGLAGVNSGIVQPDLFSNEEGIYRVSAEPTVGTRITGVWQTKMGEVIVVKDRGVLYGRPITLDDATLDFTWQILEKMAGCSTVKGYTSGDNDWVYFLGYDDIYRISGGNLESLIERRGDFQDWLYVFRNVIPKTAKESAVLWYLPQGVVKFDIGQYDSTSTVASNQFSFYPNYQTSESNGWRQDTYKATSGVTSAAFTKYATSLQNGTVLTVEVNSAGTVQGVRQWQNPTTAAIYTSDNGTAIRHKIDTGFIEFTPNDLVLNFLTLKRTFDAATTGTLDVDLYKDRISSIYKTFSNVDKTNTYPMLHTRTDDPRTMFALRAVINSNSSPEVLDSGTVLQFNGIEVFGQWRRRAKRVGAGTAASTTTGVTPTGKIAGLSEVILQKTPQTFTWDVPFTGTYTGADSTTQVSYRILAESAHPLISGVEDTSIDNYVYISAKTLTTFTAYADSDNVLFRFKAEQL